MSFSENAFESMRTLIESSVNYWEKPPQKPEVKIILPKRQALVLCSMISEDFSPALRDFPIKRIDLIPGQSFEVGGVNYCIEVAE